MQIFAISAVPPVTSTPRTPDANQRNADPQPNNPVLADLTLSDRAAIATATGCYLNPDGTVVPDANPPWAFIIRYAQQRHRQLTDAAALSAYADPSTTESVSRLDTQT